MSGTDIEKGAIETRDNHPAHRTISAAPARFANPATLGLFSFASTTFVLSMYNAMARGIHHPNVVVGMGIFCGGLAQMLAGMWEFATGNTFGAAAFSSFGGFWMSYGTILIPGSGIVAAYAGNAHELSSALGIFLICWTLVAFFFFIVAFGKSIAFIVLFGLLTTTFACLAGGELGSSAASTKAGGIIGIIVAFIAYYVGLSELLESEAHPPFRLPIGNLHPKID